MSSPDAPLPTSRTPAQRDAARKRFIRTWGVWRFGVGTGLAWGLLWHAMSERPFTWASLWTVPALIRIGTGVVVFGWFAGRWWGARFHDDMEKRLPGWRPPEE